LGGGKIRRQKTFSKFYYMRHAFSEKRFIPHSGPDLHYREAPGREGLPCILFIHGFADSGLSFTRMLEAARPENRLLLPDLRGHGASAKPASGYSPDALAGDLAGLLTALQAGPAVLVGHSLGSFVAQSLAALFPHLVERVLLISSAARTGGNAVLRELARAVLALGEDIPDAFIEEFQTPYAPVPRAFLDLAIAESKKVPVRVWKECCRELLQIDQRERLRRIQAGTMILHGAADSLFTRADQEELRALLPEAAFVDLPGAGHAPHWEQPESAAGMLEHFMRGISV
jgi:pimeloyl-ACP methyl ester carboxylesterase